MKILVVGCYDALDAPRVRWLRQLSEIGDVVIGVLVASEVPLLDRVECLRACVYVHDVQVVSNIERAKDLIQHDYVVVDEIPVGTYPGLAGWGAPKTNGWN